MEPVRRPPTLTVAAIFDAFPEGIFGLRDGANAARIAGHGSGSWPPGLTQIDLGFDGVRVQTARDQGLPSSLVINDLVFHRLTEAALAFPLTMRIDRSERSVPVDAVSTAFDTYVLDGQAVAVARVGDVCLTVRCSEERLREVEIVRFARSDVEQIAGGAGL